VIIFGSDGRRIASSSPVIYVDCKKGHQRYIYRSVYVCTLAIEPPCPTVSTGSHGDIVRVANAIRLVRT
jgi:hypothetical protein